MNNPAPTIPSPIPPWLRPVQSPTTQTLIGDDTIELGCDVTYFSQTEPSQDNVSPYKAILPNGNYKRQIKRLFIIGANANAGSSWPFVVGGLFAGFNSLIFNNVATSAVVEWDGTAWQFIGGNAQQSQTVVQ